MDIKTFAGLAKDNWKNAPQIFKGFVNNKLNEHGLLSEEKQKVIEERLNICKDCPENSLLKPKELWRDEWKTRDPEEWFCTNCGCILEYKTASMEAECPLKKWLIHKD